MDYEFEERAAVEDTLDDLYTGGFDNTESVRVITLPEHAPLIFTPPELFKRLDRPGSSPGRRRARKDATEVRDLVLSGFTGAKLVEIHKNLGRMLKADTVPKHERRIKRKGAHLIKYGQTIIARLPDVPTDFDISDLGAYDRDWTASRENESASKTYARLDPRLKGEYVRELNQQGITRLGRRGNYTYYIAHTLKK